MPPKVNDIRKLPATPGQIAELNALLRQTSALARQNNYPLTNILYNTGKQLLPTLLAKEWLRATIVATMSEWFEASSSAYRLAATFSVLTVIPLMIFVYYHLFQQLVTLVTKALPNGFGFSLQTHRAYEMQQQLGSQAQVKALIDDLRQLVSRQQSSNLFYRLLVITIILLPLKDLIQVHNEGEFIYYRQEATSIILGSSSFGAGLMLDRQDNQFAPLLFDRFSIDQQAILFDSWLARRWNAWRSPQQLATFQNHLNTIMGDYGSWQMFKADQTDKLTAIFLLQLNDSIPITVKDFVIECQRLFLLHKIPVYVRSGEQMYVGFGSLSVRTAQKIREQLNQQIHVLTEEKRLIENNLALLNKNLPKGANNLDHWQAKTDVDGTLRTTVYYCNLNDISFTTRDAYRHLLLENLPSEQRQIHNNNNIVTIQSENLELTRYQQQCQILFQRNTTLSNQPFSVVQSEKRKTQHKSNVREQTATQSDAPATPVITSKPIQFRGGVTFFSSRPQDASNKIAYPLHVPYLPEGRACAVMDPAVYPAVKHLASKKVLTNKLESGRVHGYRQGGDGIQIVGQNGKNPLTYQDIHGEYHVAQFKIKHDNLRIFGHRAQRITVDNEIYELYVFDGPKRGH